jgi:hypothetical protein
MAGLWRRDDDLVTIESLGLYQGKPCVAEEGVDSS